MVKLTAPLLEKFAGIFLSARYDQARPTPEFHRKAWELYLGPCPQAMVIAPRDHAKSTALTFDYVMAEAMFKIADYFIIIGSTEEMAQEQLSNISEELHENEDLQREFGPFVFETDQKTDIVVRFPDGDRFRILARGAEQKIRGRLWRGKRPNRIVCDDMEDDEQVESKERRMKFRRWFFRAARQAIGKGGKIRAHGTILHDDSLLNRLKRNSAWKHLFYKAHKSFDDFSEILWPERWTEEELRAKRQEFIDDNDAAGYSQEMLNDPLDNSAPYLRRDDFIAMTDEDHQMKKRIAASWDFAVSVLQSADNSSVTVGGKDVRNLVHIIDERCGRWQSPRIIDEMFSVQERWDPEVQYVEDGVIWKAIKPMVYKEMELRNIPINIVPLTSTKDKAVRGRILQKRHRAGMMRFDKEAEWYPPYEFELLRFTEGGKALIDDQFDSTSQLMRGFELLPELDDEDFVEEDEYEMRRSDPRRKLGRSKITGY